MKFLTALPAAEVAPGTMKAIELDGRELLLANIDGQYYALSRKCTHMGENLCDGTLDGNIVTCPRHGARFDVLTGKAVGKARLLFFATTPKNLQTYPVKIADGQLCIGFE